MLTDFSQVLAASIIRAVSKPRVFMMEAASTSELSINTYPTARRYNPEDCHLHIRRCENLKSQDILSSFE
jgi:hypothetical protein